MKIHVERQVSVALENQPGQLATICSILGENAVNIEAISVIDSIEQGVVRLITSDPTRCKQALQTKGLFAPCRIAGDQADNALLDTVDDADSFNVYRVLTQDTANSRQLPWLILEGDRNLPFDMDLHL